MELAELCEKIALSRAVREDVLAFGEHFDFSALEPQFLNLRNQDTMDQALVQMQKKLGSDRNGIKVLACLLKAGADSHNVYREAGIADGVYIGTMKCFSRFVEECREITGTYAFDRAQWTVRQAGGHLFRLGSLEYEIRKRPEGNAIGIHIPSDADLSPAACDASLTEAGEFFSKYFPQYKDWPYRCHSWMLAPELTALLPENSNILKFRRRFHITVLDEPNAEYLRWVYRTEDAQQLREDTTLQRNLKTHLTAGGILRDAVGILA